MIIRTLLAALACALAAPAFAQPVILEVPRVTPVPITADSRPFLYTQEFLDAVGYVEEEYFVTGSANVYDWTGEGHGVRAVAGPGTYVTRILVMRPQEVNAAGGNVEVTILNASNNADFGGPTDFARMVAQRDAWIGITSKPVTINALRTFDPVRYAPLDWSNPAPAESRCAQPSIIPTYMVGGQALLDMMAQAGMLGSWPESEDGLIWDMLGQLGLLLKSDQRTAILPGTGRPHVFMTGISQSSIYLRQWVAGFHDAYRTPDGGPVYDGYLGIVGPALPRINQCAEDVALDDPRQQLDLPDVPFISLSSEGEMWQARFTRQPDAFGERGGLVSYEVAGTSHARVEVPGLAPDALFAPSREDQLRAGLRLPPAGAPVDSTRNDLPWAPLVRGAFHNLQLWSREGIRPPQAPSIAIDADREIVRDAQGNAIGGVRMPYIDAPLFSHTGYLAAGGMGGITGSKQPLPVETLRALYPDNAAYLTQFDAATDRLLAGRFISQEDAAALKASARAALPYAP